MFRHPIHGGKVLRWAQDTRPGVLAVGVCLLLKAGSLTPLGTMTMSQKEQGEAQVRIGGLDHQDVVYEGGICQITTEIIHMGLSLMGTP